jgi:hypothetical protein
MDELERLRARNAELEATLAERPGGAPNLVTRPEPPTFKRSDLRDAAFFAAHRKDILDAASHGRIIDDLPAGGLGSAVANHYRPSDPPPDRARRDLENAAHGWQPDPQSEQAVAARAADPAAWEAAQRSTGGDLLAHSMYEAGRSAAIALGRFTPGKEGTK